jgi:hypothetical protein
MIILAARAGHSPPFLNGRSVLPVVSLRQRSRSSRNRPHPAEAMSAGAEGTRDEKAAVSLAYL